jgi:hypothetical protein
MRVGKNVPHLNSRSNHGSASCAEKRVAGDDPLPNNPAFRFANHGSVCFLHPLTDDARAWVDEHIGADNGYQPQYSSVLIEPRYCPEILAALFDAGFEVSQ